MGRAQEKLALIAGPGQTETIAFDLLENKLNKELDILSEGGQILEELAQLKADLAVVNIQEILNKWSVTFDDAFKAAIAKCCVVNSPFDVQCNLPIADDETSPTVLDDGDLLNESLCANEADFLASLSPGKRQSIAYPALESQRACFMPAGDLSQPFKKTNSCNT